MTKGLARRSLPFASMAPAVRSPSPGWAPFDSCFEESVRRMSEKLPKERPERLLSILLRDIHFWIPLLVLITGLLFLYELR